MRILNNSASWLFILCLPVLLLMVSIAWAVNSLWLYEYGFNKYDVSQTTGLSEGELEEAAIGLIDYFNSGEEYISLTLMKDGEPFDLFNAREIIHLKDVKGLFWLDYWVLLGTLIYVLGYAGISLFWCKDRPQLAGGVALGSGITLGIMLALGLGALFDFDQLFLQFHLLSFANEFWQLDPTRDYLIMLFPRGFWYDTFLFCASVTAGLALILGGGSGAYLLFLKRKQ